MFAPTKALDACRAFFIQQGVNIDVLRFDSTIIAFFAFYCEERAEGCALNAGSDILIFEWGAIDWGEGEHFELNLARQLTFGCREQRVWQLKLTYAYEPTETFRALSNGILLCPKPQDLDTFRDAVEASEAYRIAKEYAEIGIVTIGFYRVA